MKYRLMGGQMSQIFILGKMKEILGFLWRGGSIVLCRKDMI